MQSLPEQLVAEFLNAHRESGAYLGEHIVRLTELAAAEDRDTARTATRAIFASFVERLADSFEPAGVSLYNRAFAQVIQLCRANPRAGMLDRALEQFGLMSEQDLLARAERLRRVTKLSALTALPRGVRRVIVLSRVTLGADVAITSVIIERMKHSFPDAEIVLVGGEKSAQLFAGDPRVRFGEISYRRTATLIERLLTWTALLECVDDLTRGLDPGEYLIVDPDTRLTQLGLMPIARESRGDDVDRGEPEYVFFPSREYGSSTSKSLGELTSAWLDEIFGESVKTSPRVSLPGEDIEIASNVVGKMNNDRARPIVAINFGVGENPLKRVGGDFEESVAARLIQEGARIVLDKGFGEDETARADALIAKLTRIERGGRRVRAVEIGEQNLKIVSDASASENLDCEILVWNGRIGMLAALTGESDLYIGYDSAGAHIAAALGVPCIDVFAGFSSPRMLDRWRPAGKAETRVVIVDPLNEAADSSSLVETMVRDADEMLK